MDTLTQDVLDVALSYMEGLDCPRSLTVSILLRHGEVAQAVKLAISPSAYRDAATYRRAILATDFLRKCEFDLGDGVDLETKAIEKWYWSEAQCFKTNRRLNEILDFGTLNGVPCPERILSFLDRVRKNLRWLLGSSPRGDLDGRFGPGATVSDPSRKATVLHKFSSVPSLTPSALFYLVPWTGTLWASAVARRGEVPKVVKGNTFFTVNKDSSSRRSCAKEPSINGFYQLALGSAAKKQLKSRGLDLYDGQEVHRQVACAASVSGDSCTIDLTSASDCVAVAWSRLLPHSWASALLDLRSSFTRIDGRWVRLEKLSSMGNGFTFEIETAIFASIAMACDETLTPGVDLWVYGDDLILPTSLSKDVIAALKFFGFTPNEKKTFTEGPFRESCGGDFYNGQAVRPYQLESIPHEPQDWIALANGIRRAAHQDATDVLLWRDLRRTWFRILDNIPKSIRDCRGPEALGDIVVHDTEDRWRTRHEHCIRYIRSYLPAEFKGTGIWRFSPEVVLAGACYGYALYQPPRRPPPGFDNRVALARDGVTGYAIDWVPWS